VGKTAITAGLCRWLAREGVRVAPFKAQNMALNSMVTAEGGEIGRAQAMQAAAAGIAPTHLMNPVLLKPASDRRSHVIVLGQPWRDADARGYQQLKGELLDVVLDSLATLRASYDVVICEGAGSPAEINLRAETDLTEAPGLDLLPVTTQFTREKTLRQSLGNARGMPVRGYEIHHGQVRAAGGEPLIIAQDGSEEGCVAGSVSGTSWHGIFENDAFRRTFLTQVARQAGRRWTPAQVRFAQVREDWLDALGDLVADGLDTTLVRQLIADGVPAGLPSLQVTGKLAAASG
jgi:cobyric acid synthase